MPRSFPWTRWLCIATWTSARPSRRPSSAACVPHHLIDVLDPWESASVAWWLEQATRCCREIESRGKRVLFVGGTPLYLKALMFGLFDGPAADPICASGLPKRPASTARRPCTTGSPCRSRPPPSASTPNDVRRIIRALEVFELTGQADQQLAERMAGERARVQVDLPVRFGSPASSFPCGWIWPRHELYERINRRVEEMFDSGLVEEARPCATRPTLEQGSVPGRGLSRGLRLPRWCVTREAAIERVQDSQPAIRQTASHLVSPSAGLFAGHIGIDMEALATQNELVSE